MNKLFTKIATAFVGIAMAIGVGVAVGSGSDVRRADADSDTFSMSSNYKSTSGSGNNTVITWGDSVVTITQAKGTGSTAPNSSYTTAPRWYTNNLITFTPGSGITITSLAFTVSSGSTAGTWSTGSQSNNTWTGESSSAFTWKPSAQTKPTSIVITYTSGGGTGGDYEKATSVSVGDKILLVYETGKYELGGISSTSTKYGLGESYSSAPAGVYPLDVVNGYSSGTVSLKNGSNYLTWTSGNSLNVTTTQSDNSSWTITISNGNATIANKADSTRTIRWNNTSGQYRFACYTSGQQAIQVYKLSSSEPSVSIETASTSVTWDGSNSQTIAFTATVSNFSDDAEDILYEWRSSNSNAISVTNVGSDSTANLKVVGAGNATITCYALGLSEDEATSEGVLVTVSNETYSGSLSITSSGDILTESEGEITYSLTGNTHPMDTYAISSDDDDVIAVSYNSSTGKFEYLAGDTPNATATVTITLSSSIYTLESYQASLNVRLVDASAVASVTTNYDNRNVTIGGSNLSFTATVTLVGGGDATGKQVTWTPTDSGVCTINASQDTLTGTVVPVNVGSTTVRVASVDDPTKYHDVTVNVSGPADKTLNSITINKGDGYKHEYYDDEESVDLTGLSLTANYVNALYPSYSENVAVANNASGVVWTLDLTNEKVKVAYTVDQITEEDEFAITVSERPKIAYFVSANLGITDQASAVGEYSVGLFTFAFVQDTGTNPPKYYANGSSVRMYNNNYLRIVASESVDTIDELVITVDSKSDFSVETNEGGSYTRDGLDITFTDTNEIILTAGSNQFRPVTIDVHYTLVKAADKDVESVTITPQSVSVESGKTANISVAVLPVDARDTSVTWTSDDEDVAVVEEDGTMVSVRGVAPGTTTITAQSNDQPSISDSITVTVTAGPVIEYSASAAIEGDSGSQVLLGGTYFDLTVSGGSYRGVDGSGRGAQFSSGKEAVSVGLNVTDIAVATQDLRVIVEASRNANGTATLGVKLGTTDLLCNSSSSVTLTTSNESYEFNYSGSASSTVSLTDLVKISLSNNGGAIFVKSIKVYSGASQSVIGNFTTNSLRMESYDKGGSQGSTAGDGSCKAWWNDVNTAYGNLTDGQKAVFGSDDQYAAARLRLNEWARINGYSYNSETGITKNAMFNQIAITSQVTNTSIIVIVTVGIAAIAIGGYFLLRKKKED